MSSVTNYRDYPLVWIENKLPEINTLESERFKNLLSRLKPVEKKALFTKMDTLKHKQLIHRVVYILEKGDYRDPFFLQNRFDTYALEACRTGRISVFQFCDLMTLKVALPSFKQWNQVKRIPLFQDDGNINPEAWKLISFTCKTPPKEGVFLPPPILDDDQLKVFFKRMQSATPDEQHFFVVPRDYPQKESLGWALYSKTRFNLFGIVCTEPVGLSRIVATQKMFETARAVKFGKQAMKANHVIGISTADDLVAAGLLGKRDKAIPMAGHPLPKTGDDKLAKNDDFPYHDEYHLFTASAAPSGHRIIILNLSKEILNFIKSLALHKQQPITPAYDYLADLETAEYVKERHSRSKENDINENFWKFIIGLPRLANPFLLEHLGIYKVICDYLKNHQAELEKNGITFQKLSDLSNSLNPKLDKSLLSYLIKHFK